MNVLREPVFSVEGASVALSLPALFARMARDEPTRFVGLRVHQGPAWHAFLVQLGALCAFRRGWRALPRVAETWAEGLRALTPGSLADAPWRLCVADYSVPAFLQPPVGEEDAARLRFVEAETPDLLDILVGARHFDLRRGVMHACRAEDWVYALVTSQTSAGYEGGRRYGVSRMNGGASSRAFLGLAPARAPLSTVPDAARWWVRDVTVLLREEGPRLGRAAHRPALVWCLPWPERETLRVDALHPWYIEVCRRVRIFPHGRGFRAERAGSAAARIDAGGAKGRVGDPWLPINVKLGKALTVARGVGFGYRRIGAIYWSDEWEAPLLARAGADEIAAGEPMVLVAQTLVRGVGRTAGLARRCVPVPGACLHAFGASREAAAGVFAVLIQAVVDCARIFSHGLALASVGGRSDAVDRRAFDVVSAPRAALHERLDPIVYSGLWGVLAAGRDGPARERAMAAFVVELVGVACSEFDAALAALPLGAGSAVRGRGAARRLFARRVAQKWPSLAAPAL